MQVLNKMAKVAETSLGEQTVRDDAKYRVMRFVEIRHIDGADIAYNNMTKEMISLSSAEIEILNSEEISPTDDSIPLIKKWFLVPVDEDEIQLNDQLVEVAKLLKKNNAVNNFVILPTTDCNARCFYCFEAGAKKINMDKKTAVDVARYIKRVSKGKHVIIRWFGGEPLYNYEAIDIICKKLRRYRISYNSMIVTNAFLFTPKMVLRAKKLWHLTFAQVTLDGTEKIYNRTKNYINCQGLNPFEIVLSNIYELISNKITVKIRLNMDKHNSSDLYELIDLLYKRFGNNDYLKIYAHLLFEDFGYHKIKRNDLEQIELNNAFFELEDYLAEKEFGPFCEVEDEIRYATAEFENVKVIPGFGLVPHDEKYFADFIEAYHFRDRLFLAGALGFEPRK